MEETNVDEDRSRGGEIARGWISISIVIGAALLSLGISWGVVQSSLSVSEEDNRAFRDQFDATRTSLTRMEIALIKIEGAQRRIEIGIESKLTNIGTLLDALVARTVIVEDRMLQVWPRIRTNTENIVIIKQILESTCACEVELRIPQQY